MQATERLSTDEAQPTMALQGTISYFQAKSFLLPGANLLTMKLCF